MGNRELVSVITDRSVPKIAQGYLGNIVFVAPDVDRTVFARQLSGGVDAPRLTLYASSHDWALSFSGLLHHDTRAGDSDPNVLILPNVETTDASLVDTGINIGHSYYRTSWSVLSDIHFLIQDNMPAGRRFGLIPTKSKDGTYWVFRP